MLLDEENSGGVTNDFDAVDAAEEARAKQEEAEVIDPFEISDEEAVPVEESSELEESEISDEEVAEPVEGEESEEIDPFEIPDEEEQVAEEDHPELEGEEAELHEEQAEESDYFEKQQEKIQKTKEKLQALLEKLQNQPAKETIAKKLLRVRINRLRVKLNRQMEKFDIEYQADLQENEEYASFLSECDEIRERLEKLEDREDYLLYQLEECTRRENYRGSRDVKLDRAIKGMSPKGKTEAAEKRSIKSTPRRSRQRKIERELDEVGSLIEMTERHLQEKIEDYKTYKQQLQSSVKDKVSARMQELKEEEKERRRQEKEQLAVEKPSVWAKIRGAVKQTVERISAWNEKRKQAKVERSAKKDELVTSGTDELLQRKTAREKFAQDLYYDAGTIKTIRETVEEAMGEKEEQTEPEKEEPEQPAQEGKEPGDE